MTDEFRENLTASWRDEADCALAADSIPGMENAWVSSDPELQRRAIAICETCPVREMCITSAVHSGDARGIRGGFFFMHGRVLSEDAWAIKKLFGVRARIRQRVGRKSKPDVEQKHAS